MNNEPSTPKQHDAKVLADIVQITLHGAHDHCADRLHSGCGQDRLDVGHSGFHGSSRYQDLGYEHIPLAEFDADNPHPGNQPIVHDLKSAHAVLKGFPGELINSDHVSIDQGSGDFLHKRRGPAE